MRCDTHCPPGAGSGLYGLLLALGGFVALSLVVWALSKLHGVLLAAAIAVNAAWVLAIPVLMWRAGFRLERRERVANRFTPDQPDPVETLPAAPSWPHAPARAEGGIVER